jgi:hypothetical protein
MDASGPPGGFTIDRPHALSFREPEAVEISATHSELDRGVADSANASVGAIVVPDRPGTIPSPSRFERADLVHPPVDVA